MAQVTKKEYQFQNSTSKFNLKIQFENFTHVNLNSNFFFHQEAILS
jgi:hypothetical protein